MIKNFEDNLTPQRVSKGLKISPLLVDKPSIEEPFIDAFS
jgi:hypothetical protein